MKLAAVLLVVLGLFAAGSAALLMRMLTMPSKAERAMTGAEPEVEILVATRALEAMSVVDSKSVATKKVPKSQVPANVLASSVQVIGRILTTPVMEGEAFRETAFARDGSPVHLAAALPPGKRAVSVQLRDWSAMAGLIYPGSVVDVVVSITFSSLDSPGGESISTTLLQGLQVLAVGSQSVASEEYTDKEPGALSGQGKYQHRMVTLLVDPKQAELLQLAVEHGTVSLTMRNPMDRDRASQRITRMGDISGNSFAGPRSPNPPLEPEKAAQPVKGPAIATGPTPEKATETDIFADPKGDAGQKDGTQGQKPRDLWEMLIIRGDSSETQTFPLPSEENGKAVAQSRDPG